MNTYYSGKTIVITGAASGIGRALANKLSALGANLALSDINLEELENTHRRLTGTGQVSIHALDVANREAFEAYAKEVIRIHDKVDIIINNAGVSVSDTIEDMAYEDMEWIFNINFWGVVYGTKSFLPYLKERPEAAIVNISSIFGIVALPAQGAYSATKFAVNGFTQVLRQELKETNVQVSCVHPGGIKTNIVRNGVINVSLNGDRSPKKMIAKDFEEAAWTTPEQAAEVIIKGVYKKKRRILVGGDAHIMEKIQQLLPVRHTDIINWIISLNSRG